MRYPNLIEIKAPMMCNLGRLIIKSMSKYAYAKLQVIDFTSDSLTGEEVAKLCQRCPHLQSLSLGVDINKFADASVYSIVTACPSITKLHLIGGSLASAALVYIAQLHHLTHLDLSAHNTFANTDIHHLVKSCTGLEVLNIGVIDVTNFNMLQYIGTYCPKLRELRCRKGRRIDDATVRIPDMTVISLLQSCPRLEVLALANYSPTDTVLQAIGQHCPLFKFILFDATIKTYSDRGLIALSHGCPHLSQLHINKNDSVTNSTIITCAEYCHNLTSIHIDNKDITSTTICELLKANTGLTHIQVDNCDGLNDSVIYTISQYCTKLTYLSLSYCMNITEEALITLFTHCTMLTEIYITHTKITINFIHILTKYNKYIQKVTFKYAININILCFIPLLKYSKYLYMILVTHCSIYLTNEIRDIRLLC